MRYVQPYGLPDYGAGEGQSYVNGDPTIGREGSIPPAEAFEHPQREIVNLIKNAGFSPSEGDLEQVTRGVRQQINYATATFVAGSPNDYSLILDPPLDSYRIGLTLRIKIPVACTGPTTLNIDSLGSRAINRANGAATSANDLLANMVVELVYDGTAWQIVNFQGFTSSTTNNNTYIVDIPYAVDVGTPNHLVAPFAPALTSVAAGKLVLVKVANTNTGGVDIAVNALAVKPVIRAMLTPLAPGDIIPGMVIALVYDGVSWQMISMPASTPRFMTGPQSLYVNGTTGHDINYDGRSATVSGSTGPFRTIGRAIVEMVKWTNIGFRFSIFVADGTYNEDVNCQRINGSGECWIQGNDANPSACHVHSGVNNPAAAAFGPDGGGYSIHGFKLSSQYGNGFAAGSGGGCAFWNIDFGACGNCHIYSIAANFIPQGGFDVNAKIIISGSAQYHLNTYGGVCLASGFPNPFPELIISQSVSFNTFILAQGGATAAYVYETITGASNVVAGKKYSGIQNSIIDSGGRGLNYYPGPVAGTLATGAQYT